MATKKRVSAKKLVTSVVIEEIGMYNRRTPVFLPAYKVIIGFNFKQGQTYTRAFRDGTGFRIQIGGQMFVQYLGIPDYIYNAADVPEFIKNVRKMARAFFYHEIGHLLFTDMYDKSIIEYKPDKYRAFIHTIFNVMEDPRMERYGMAVEYPKSAKYFKFMVKKMFEEHMTDYKDDPNNPGAFINFLLFKLRLGKKFKGTSAVWEAHKAKLQPLVLAFLNEDDPTLRVKKAIVVAEYLIKNTKWDFSTIDPPENPISGSLSGIPGMGSSGSAGTVPGSGGAPGLKPKKGHKADKKKGKGKGKGEGEGSTGNSDEGKVKGADENSGGGSDLDGDNGGNITAGSSSNNRGSDRMGADPEKRDFDTVDELEDSDDDDEEVEERYSEENDLLLENCPEVDDSYNNSLDEYNGENHTFLRAKDYYIPTPSTSAAIRKRLDEVSKLATGVKAALDVYRGRIRPKWNRGFLTGKLDMRKAMSNSLTHGCDTHLFQRKIANGIAPDLAISVLCDNSGSMGRQKSHVCTTAMLALARACQLCNIPIEVNCFTETGGMNYTIQAKGFDDPYDQAKEFFGITDGDIYAHYLDDNELKYTQFCGNEDEVNLNYVWKQFMRNKHKDKLIIVISDGETCGSSDRLRQLTQDIERSGINIIGLGIQSHAVASLYKHYKLFDTESTLEDLPAFMTTTLLNFCTNKGGK